MTDLPKRLGFAGRREAGKASKDFSQGAHLIPKDYWYNSGYQRGHRSLHHLIQKMAEALEKIRAANKPLECETEGPGDMHYWYQQELKSRDIAHEALAELEKYLGGV